MVKNTTSHALSILTRCDVENAWEFHLGVDVTVCSNLSERFLKRTWPNQDTSDLTWLTLFNQKLFIMIRFAFVILSGQTPAKKKNNYVELPADYFGAKS